MAFTRPRGRPLPRRVVWNPHAGRKLPQYDWRRFPRPVGEAVYLLKRCLWCDMGDLGWDNTVGEYRCIQCGWREFESIQRKEEV